MSHIAINDLLMENQWLQIVNLLRTGDLQWSAGRELGRTATGESYQLGNREQHDTPSMRELSELMAGVVFGELSRCGIVDTHHDLTPQVFPVIMFGSELAPPHQDPHVDTALVDGRPRSPLINTVYYLIADDLRGGELVAINTDGVEEFVHVPRSNQLLIMRGAQRHMVRPLLHGTRISVVVNFYRL